MKMLVLGGGTQGRAAAFELLSREAVDSVVVADANVAEVPAYLADHVGGKLSFATVDATDHASIRSVMEGRDAVMCALPYFFNLEMTRLAIECGAHFCDLGGNTEIVESQKKLSGEAERAGVSVVPDSGLAPGMVNILAQAGIDGLDEPNSVRIWVGGLPQHPKPPLNYQIVYSMKGVLDYYSTHALVLENGEPVMKESLTGLETLTFPEPVGELEAFYTGGGISTLPYRYRGRIQSMSYKTLRYPGHARIMKAVRDLGLIGMEPVPVGDAEVIPRDVFIEVVSPLLRNSAGDDLVAVRVEVSGSKDGENRTIRHDLLDRYDPETGLTAMMRTTGFSLAITGVMQADGRIASPGVNTPDECVPAAAYLAELAAHGVCVERSEV